jgi:tetratricopeptide (TPR) repeat protein
MMFERAITADPNHANGLGNYALFLAYDLKDPARAELMFERALAADPNHANNLGNYAQFLFISGKDYGDFGRPVGIVEGLLARDDIEKSIRLEICFYLLVHKPELESRVSHDIYRLIIEGVRSIGWSFDSNIDWAESHSDTRTRYLRLLADVITGLLPVSVLEGEVEWEKWRHEST